MKDYYKILQVDRSADSELIKKIFNYREFDTFESLKLM